jgi:hypothetical protein
MSPLNIVIIVVVIVLIILILRYWLNNPAILQSSVQSGQTSSTIDSSSLATDGSNAPPTNFTYSVWFYIDNWNYRYGHEKVIFGRMGKKAASGSSSTTDSSGNSSCDASGNTGGSTTSSSSSTSGSPQSTKQIHNLAPCPAVLLGAVENNIDIALTCFASPKQQQNGNPTIVHNCAVTNIPIQRWVNLLFSVYGRTLDIYIDGKLVRTCLLPGIAVVHNNADIYVTPLGGFSGWTSKLQYWANSFNPQQAWNIYKQGYRSALFGSDYEVQVSLLENGSTQSTYTLG